ncbi:hypothetical protein K435DRAFT_302185 [Dendrothele bispora CBS 962.96]|uniref:Uncharacterized protein n=1 Tax=Dendrothele bispora (strain CBS 962.96) TaxID=1314807 RepID=A0A4S8LIG8_DENBC|nr:hypothetical protein K435DRAFT_302185 [Dendrothele bispora CBS 962.96]
MIQTPAWHRLLRRTFDGIYSYYHLTRTFIYPLLTQTAWATLIYNVTLTFSPKPRWNPLSTAAYNPSSFADQLNDTGSILYINPDVPNTLPEQNISAAGAGYSDLAGIEKFAYSVGIRPQDLFPVCMVLWLGIVAGVVAVSILIWFVDEVAGIGSGIISGRRSTPTPFGVSSRVTRTRSPTFGSKNLVMATTSNLGWEPMGKTRR